MDMKGCEMGKKRDSGHLRRAEPFLPQREGPAVRATMRYKTRQLLAFRRLTGLGERTHRMASSNTLLRPFCVSAEHSKYRSARISLAIWTPWE